MSEQHNPYSTPTTDVASDALSENIAPIKKFKRFTTWGVLGLAIITLGIYVYYWMVTRTKTLNSLIPENKIPMWIPFAVIGLGIINIFFSFVPIALPEMAQQLAMVSIPFSIAGMVLNLVWVFKFRNRLNLISKSTKGSIFWLGGVITFFFQLYYFQYKINEMQDASSLQPQSFDA